MPQLQLPVQIFVYAAVVFCLVAVVVRSLRYGRAPVHLRWELYPVAHERGRAHYGGSIFEESDWWTRTRRPDHGGALRAMAAEIVLLAGVRHHNPALWRRSWPFHAGLYLLIVWLLGNLGQGIAVATGHGGGTLSTAASTATTVVGFTGLVLALGGAVALAHRRLVDPALRAYNAPSDILNLAVFVAWLGTALGVHAVERGFASLVTAAAALVAFQPLAAPAGVQVELALGGVVLVWLPLSRMFHFVAKYFLYHRVRWEDAPNPRGGALERRLQQAMTFGVGWSAPHVGEGRTWQDAATTVAEEPR